MSAHDAWTRPYHGITHLGELRDERRVTVDDRGNFALLSRYMRGHGRLSETTHASVEEAKRAGERWIAGSEPVFLAATARRAAAKVEKMEDRPLKKQLESLCRTKKGTGSTRGMTILTIKNPTEANAEAVDLLVRSMFSTVIHPSFGVYYVRGDAEGAP